MAVLIYSVHCIHGGTALIFRTLYPWLYEVLALKGATKLYITNCSRVVIILFSKGL